MAFDGGAVVRGKDICTAATFAATRVEIAPPGSAKFTPPCSRGRQTRRCKSLRRRCRALRAVCRRGAWWSAPARRASRYWRMETQLSPRSANAALQRLRRRCCALRAVCRRGLGGQHQHAGRAGTADRNAVIPEVGKRGVAKVTAAMPRAAGGMPARGLAASTSTAGQPVLADGNAVIPGNGGDALRFARIVSRPFRAVAHNSVRISPRFAAIIPYFPAAFNRPRCNPNFA